MNTAVPPRAGDADPVHTAAPRAGVVTALAAVARDRPSQWVFTAISVIAVLGYALLLPAEHTGHVAASNYGHLTGQDAVFSVVLGLTVAAVLTVQVFALRHAPAQRRATGTRAALGGLGALGAVVPGLCCTAVLPAVVGLVGVSAAGSASIMEALAPNALFIDLGIVLLLVAIGWWSLRRLSSSGCLDADGCPTTGAGRGKRAQE
ncbi:hypothetical protein [Mycobacterium sp.]|uniref:hypothetical protein n=1 Tax=Mycobacterium sp. TaxID=1785 RepID=UPI0031DC265E